ncbi:MFS transporter [Luteolibacter sp. GHJ8]|uniref:MFS transporter n=1 Tax=Luteolibacter rhizosphaerae TaxID=2989719 RepID=A0ABT3FYJ3_9BACT|nr:MFS transporter [Luteolibacter rhizosphaerae]MCW1912080.1 MFS transporter [Luteolibacter rhizosphaerae]
MNRAWLVVALLVPVALLNYLDRQMLATMKSSVMADIPGIGLEANWGKILAWFKWTYAIVSPIGGYLADRFSRRHVIAGSLFAWSLITWLTGQVSTYEQLLATRAIMGVSEALYIPAALALIADFHRGPTRSKAIGIHQMGIYCGVILGGFSGYAADSPDHGWRWAFDVCGIIGIVYAIPLFFLLRNPVRDPMAELQPHLSPLAAMGELLSNRSFLLLVAYFTLPALAGWVVRDWMPAILKAEFNIGQGKAGVSAALYWQSAAILGAMIGGFLADRWMRRTPRGRIYISAIGMSLIVPAMFGTGYAPQTGQLSVAIAFLILFGLGWGFFDCNNMPILCQIAPPELRATGYGLMNLVSISCGGFADYGFGALQDRGVPLFASFSIFASAAVISVILVLLIRPRDTESTLSQTP